MPPSTEILGTDIDLAQVPPASWVPSNVSFRAQDAFAEPAADLVGRFDLVHVRLLLFLVKDDDPVPLLKNLMKMLSKSMPLDENRSITELIYRQSLEDGYSGKNLIQEI